MAQRRASDAPGIDPKGSLRSLPAELSNLKTPCKIQDMKTMAIENASLPDLLIELRGEGEILLTDHAAPVAKLISLKRTAHVPSPASLQNRREALTALKELGGVRDVIGDPAEWQRAMRQDRPLPLID
jgi:hypothetical protein